MEAVFPEGILGRSRGFCSPPGNPRVGGSNPTGAVAGFALILTTVSPSSEKPDPQGRSDSEAWGGSQVQCRFGFRATSAGEHWQIALIFHAPWRTQTKSSPRGDERNPMTEYEAASLALQQASVWIAAIIGAGQCSLIGYGLYTMYLAFNHRDDQHRETMTALGGQHEALMELICRTSAPPA